MFPSKVKVENLDPKNKKVKDLELSSISSITAGQVKLVIKKAGERAPFYYIANFFVKNSKPIGDLFALGNNMKLEKHFLQNEMKKSKSSVLEAKQDIKKAAMGEIYLDKINNKPTLHFEPHEKSQIPSGKWPKILKDLKSYFPSGMKAVVVIDGKVIQGEESKDGETPVKVAAVAPTKEDKTIEENVVTVEFMASEYKDLLAEFKEAQDAHHDKDVVKILYRELVSWGKDFKTMNPQQQGKLAKFNKSFTATLDSVKKIIKADSAIDKKVANVESIVKKYLQMPDHDSADAKKAHDEAAVVLEEIIKYCKFIKDNELKSKCETLKSILAS